MRSGTIHRRLDWKSPALDRVECGEHPSANQPPSVGSSVGRPQLAPRLGPFLFSIRRPNETILPARRNGLAIKAGYRALVLISKEYHPMIEAVAVVMGLACVAIFVAFAVEAYLIARN